MHRQPKASNELQTGDDSGRAIEEKEQPDRGSTQRISRANRPRSVHNSGDTNAVHVSLNGNGEIILDTVIKGDTVREVLDYVQFNADTLLSQFRRDVEAALLEGKIGYEESGRLLRFYEDGLHGYTYLEDAHER